MSGHDGGNVLRTERLLLRPFSEDDRSAILEIFSDARTMEYWSAEPIGSIAEAEKLLQADIEWAALKTTRAWAIALPDTNRYAGKISLFQIDEQNRRAEIGYLLGRQHWGKGLMTEAMSTVLAYAFNEMGLHRIEVDTDPDNLPSLALLDRFGFSREGYFRDRWRVHGAWHDSVMLALLEDEYRKNSLADAADPP